MKKRQRVRVCGNLLMLLEQAKSDRLRELWRRQYFNTASRINENQPTGVGAGRLNTNFQNSITVIVARNEGERNAFVC